MEPSPPGGRTASASNPGARTSRRGGPASPPPPGGAASAASAWPAADSASPRGDVVSGLLAVQCRLGRADAAAVLTLDGPEASSSAEAGAADAGGGSGEAAVVKVFRTPRAQAADAVGGVANGGGEAPEPAWLGVARDRARYVQPLGPSMVIALESSRGRLYGDTGGRRLVLMGVGSAIRSLAGVEASGAGGSASAASGAASGCGACVEAFLVDAHDERELKHRVELLELSRAVVDLHGARATAGKEAARARRLAGVIEGVEATASSSRFRASAMALCNELCSRFGAERVSVGFVSGRYVKLAGMSQTEHLHRRMQAVQDVESAMEECVDQDVEVVYPGEPTTPVVTRSAEELAKQHGPSAVASLPLRDAAGEPRGVVTLERAADRAWSGEDLLTLRLLCNLVSPRLLELHAHDRWFGARWASATRTQSAKVLGPQHTWAKAAAVAALGFVLFAVFARGTDWVEGSFTVEPVVARTVAAPWSGYLAEVNVEPGDAVVAGETVLGELDASEVRLELAQAEADAAQHRTEADLAWRESREAERLIALAQARRAEAKAELLRYRVRKATLVAPVSGVVTRGDLRQELGRPVEQGQVLFEVAPLEAGRNVRARAPRLRRARGAGGRAGDGVAPGAEAAVRGRARVPGGGGDRPAERVQGADRAAGRGRGRGSRRRGAPLRRGVAAAGRGGRGQGRRGAGAVRVAVDACGGELGADEAVVVIGLADSPD